MNGRFSARLFRIFSFQAWRQPKWAFQGFATPTNARECAFAGWALQQQTAARLAFRSRVLTRFLRLLPFLKFRPISHHRPKPWRKECEHGLPLCRISCASCRQGRVPCPPEGTVTMPASFFSQGESAVSGVRGRCNPCKAHFGRRYA